MRLSILDLALVRSDQSIRDALRDMVTLAQKAEQVGRFERIWYAEHHNMPSIASAATSVLIAHVAAHTSTIRLGAGGVMLPNHSPLVIAEQFGTLAELHPDRIDLGLGRAPGTDQRTLRALRRDPAASDYFPQDVQELSAYLAGESLIPGVEAIPGRGTRVPLYILGSSTFGAQLAAYLGLPYAFASHFAPDFLHDAIAIYRNEFRPSAQLAEPYVIVGCNVIAHDDPREAQRMYDRVLRSRVKRFAPVKGPLTDEDVETLLQGLAGDHARNMLRYTATGDASQVAAYLTDLQQQTDADELMFTNQAIGLDERLRALEIVSQAVPERG